MADAPHSTAAPVAAAAAAAAATARLLQGNRLDRGPEAEELAECLARCLARHHHNRPHATSGGNRHPNSSSTVHHVVHAQLQAGAELARRCAELTDRVSETLASTHRQQQLQRLNESTRRLREKFDAVDVMQARLAAFAAHLARVQARKRDVQSAKEKKYPRYMKVGMRSSCWSWLEQWRWWCCFRGVVAGGGGAAVAVCVCALLCVCAAAAAAARYVLLLLVLYVLLRVCSML